MTLIHWTRRRDKNDVDDHADDFCDDGSDNFDVALHGSDLGKADTDGDGFADNVETDQGSDPTRPTDKGEPPADDMIARMNLHGGRQRKPP